MIVVFLLLAIGRERCCRARLYRGGWKLAVIGSASYLAPLVGIAAGYFLATSEDAVYRVMKVYTLLNAVMLIGVPLEYLDYDIPDSAASRRTGCVTAKVTPSI